MTEKPGDNAPHIPYPLPLDIIHRYWREPWHEGNNPQSYLDDDPRGSLLMLDVIKRCVTPEARILEIGCNAGRNLHHLYQAGFHNLEAIEISSAAVTLLRNAFPDMAAAITLHNAPVENVIRQLPDDHFDLVFTMAVLEHIHYDSDWVFPEIGRITRRCIVTFEDERGFSMRHFPRNYQHVFEPLGLQQVETLDIRPVFGPAFEGRVFKKA